MVVLCLIEVREVEEPLYPTRKDSESRAVRNRGK